MHTIKSSEILTEPLDAVVFDCDGTLSHIEGIDELARANGVGEQIEQMTAIAMAKTGLNLDLYKQRLALVQPTKQQVLALGQTYLAECTQDASSVINLFHQLHKPVYIISAGVNPAVSLFGLSLGVSQLHIFAVDVYFKDTGEYIGFDEDSPLVRSQGKRQIIAHIQQKHQRLLYVGDGLNDLEASDMVTRFVGYGGAFYRANIAAQCEFYLRNESLAALLPLALTAGESAQLELSLQKLYQKGLRNL